jgi:putative lipoic acid-binding regulatory protein
MTAQHEVKYPVTIPLKVVMHSKEEAGKNVADLMDILAKTEIPLRGKVTENKSSAGKYTSYTVPVYVENKEKMHALYEALKAHPDVKFAI